MTLPFFAFLRFLVFYPKRALLLQPERKRFLTTSQVGVGGAGGPHPHPRQTHGHSDSRAGPQSRDDSPALRLRRTGPPGPPAGPAARAPAAGTGRPARPSASRPVREPPTPTRGPRPRGPWCWRTRCRGLGCVGCGTCQSQRIRWERRRSGSGYSPRGGGGGGGGRRGRPPLKGTSWLSRSW